MSVSLTPKQATLLGFLKAYIAQHGCGPTIDEMVIHTASGRSAIVRHLNALEERGRIRRLRFRARAIEITETPDPHDAARDALTRVGAQATAANITRVAGALCECLGATA